MAQHFDFVVVGAGSAGAALAARLSEDPGVTVALVEAGGRPPEREAMPVACASLQLDPETDWMFTGDPGKGGLGFKNRRMPVPRGKMLGGSSGINYMVWVRGHPGDFDNWERLGATGWSHEDVLPCFKRMEEVFETNEAVISRDLRGNSGPVGVSIRSPVIPAARDFVKAAAAMGIPEGDYNGLGRHAPGGVASLVQTNTRRGKRSSTFHAYLEDAAENRPNLTIITHALVQGLRWRARATAWQWRVSPVVTAAAPCTKSMPARKSSCARARSARRISCCFPASARDANWKPWGSAAALISPTSASI